MKKVTFIKNSKVLFTLNTDETIVNAILESDQVLETSNHDLNLEKGHVYFEGQFFREESTPRTLMGFPDWEPLPKDAHWSLHAQAIVKDKFITHVLFFYDHDQEYINKVTALYDHTEVLNICDLHQFPLVGATWDGTTLRAKPYDSWHLGEDLEWYPPMPKPEIDGVCCWHEPEQSWVTLDKQRRLLAQIPTEVPTKGFF